MAPLLTPSEECECLIFDRDSRIVLEGTVHSVFEASQAEDLAWNTPGVVEVENRLEVAA